MAKLTILKKISMSTVNTLSKGGFKGITAQVFGMRILGMARGFEVVQTPYGDSLKFKGEFRAFGQEGNECASSVAYLPSPVDEMLKSAIENGDGKPVEFAFDVNVVPDESSSVGYVYRVETLTEAAPSDPVARLVNSLPTLPKPAQEALPLEGAEQQPKAEAAPEAKADAGKAANKPTK